LPPVDDGRAQRAAEYTTISNGKCTSGHFIHGDLSFPGTEGQSFYLGLDSPKAKVFGISDHGHHQTFGSGYRNTDVTEIIGDHLLAIDHRVHGRVHLQSSDHRFGEEGHKSEAYPMLVL